MSSPPPLTVDPIYGPCYIDPMTFKADAPMYGCARAIGYLTDDQITRLVALTSREVDNYCGRTFTPDPIIENHKFDQTTRRVSPNCPPVIQLNRFDVQIAPTVISTFQPADVLINNQENYLELATLAAIASQQLTSTVVALGITEPQVWIEYLSYQDVPKSVAAATALAAAWKANESYGASAIVPGFQVIKSKEQELERNTKYTWGDGIPNEAKNLLRSVTRIVAV